MAVDVGTLGKSPVLLAINEMLIKAQDKNLTGRVTGTYLQAKEDIAKLKRHLKDRDLKFYARMLTMLRKHHMAVVEAQKNGLPHDMFTHLRCAVVGEFREAFREISEGLKENVRRRQRGQQPL